MPPKKTISVYPWECGLRDGKQVLCCEFCSAPCPSDENAKKFDFPHVAAPLPSFSRKESGSVTRIKRSPQLSVLDFCIWNEINKKFCNANMGDRNESWESAKKRLRKIAMGLPKEFIKRACGDIARRCQMIKDAKGGYIGD